jgi:DNA-binding winged helix-turn-helix (wHTH) protein
MNRHVVAVVSAADRIDELEETVRQYKEALAPVTNIPKFWGLAPNELRILISLYNAPEGFRSRAQLMAAIGGIEKELQNRNIDVYMCRLRTKSAPHGITITTVHGQGFRLDQPSKAIIKKTIEHVHEQPAEPRLRKGRYNMLPFGLSNMQVMLLIKIMQQASVRDLRALLTSYGREEKSLMTAVYRISSQLATMNIRLCRSRTRGYWFEPEDSAMLKQYLAEWYAQHARVES